MVTINYRESLTASTPHKALTTGGKRSMGRNNQGRITTRHKGGGNKRKYRLIDFLYSKHDIPAKIETVEGRIPLQDQNPPCCASVQVGSS